MQLTSPFFITLDRDTKIACILAIIVLLSAIIVTHTKHVIRGAYARLHILETTHRNTVDEWHKALIEHSTWSSNSRIHAIATQKLHMYKPSKQTILKP